MFVQKRIFSKTPIPSIFVNTLELVSMELHRTHQYSPNSSPAGPPLQAVPLLQENIGGHSLALEKFSRVRRGLEKVFYCIAEKRT